MGTGGPGVCPRPLRRSPDIRRSSTNEHDIGRLDTRTPVSVAVTRTYDGLGRRADRLDRGCCVTVERAICASPKSARRPTRRTEDPSGLGAVRTDNAAIGSRSGFSNAQLCHQTFSQGTQFFGRQVGQELIEAGGGRCRVARGEGLAGFFEAGVGYAVGGGVVLGGDLEAGVA